VDLPVDVPFAQWYPASESPRDSSMAGTISGEAVPISTSLSAASEVPIFRA